MMRKFDQTLRFFSTRISPKAFFRLALVISGVWLLAMYPALNWFCPEKLPKQIRVVGCDFWPYYSGALAARHGLWNHLYPTPNQAVYNNPPQFKPLIATKLFNPSADRRGQWAFYPQVASPEASIVSSEILALCPQLQGRYQFFYPPPLAVLLWPLGFFECHTALNGVWFWLMCASFFGMTYYASRICRTLWRQATYIEGGMALLLMIPICLGSGSTALIYGNVTPLLGFLIAWVAYAWLCNRQIAMSLGIIPLVLFKGIGISWCPLLLVKPVKWRTLVGLTALTLLINGVAFYYGGIEPYRTFFVEMLPKGSIALGLGLQGLLLVYFGVNLKSWISLLNLILLGFIYWGYWRRSKATRHPSTVLATVAGTLAIFCLCNDVVWAHYFPTYLMFPFAGWILWEGFQAKGAWKKWIFGMFILSALFWFDSVFTSIHWHLTKWLQYNGHYNKPIELIFLTLSGFYVILSPLQSAFLLALAYRRLFFLTAPQGEEERVLAHDAK